MSESSPTAPNESLTSEATAFLIDIESKLPENKGSTLSEDGRINEEGREIAEEVYADFLNKADGDFGKVLELCKQTSTILDKGNDNLRDNEMTRIVQSIRGKVVYNAHKTWVDHEMRFNTRIWDTSASAVMHNAEVAKNYRLDNEINIYEEASNLRNEKLRINKELNPITNFLEKENAKVITEDIAAETISIDIPEVEKKSIVEGIKEGIDTFTKKLVTPQVREKVSSIALSFLKLSMLYPEKEPSNEISTLISNPAEVANSPITSLQPKTEKARNAYTSDFINMATIGHSLFEKSPLPEIKNFH